MFERSRRQRNQTAFLASALLACCANAYGTDLSNVKTLMDRGRPREAIKLLAEEVEENPAHDAARVLLAQAYEKANAPDKAIGTWQELLIVSRSEANLHKARRALCRLHRQRLDETDIANLSSPNPREDPFTIDMPAVDWDGLEVIEDSSYRPPILPPPHDREVPAFAHETEHFTVYSANEGLSEVIGERAEIYLDFMSGQLFGGRSWAVRFPIIVYPTYNEYVKHGAPAGTGGVTMHHLGGQTRCILLYQLQEGGGRRGSRRGSLWRYGIESVLPHELTHAVVNEFFAGRPAPLWLHEAAAQRFEQTRDHYGEAARLARKVAAGQYFRLRDLFSQEAYPSRVSLFYEQAAAFGLYLFESGPKAMHTFLTELAAGNGHDDACAAVLGIPKQNAIEEFERRWVEWMRIRYIKALDNVAGAANVVTAHKGNEAAFSPLVNELDTVESIPDNWRSIDLGSLDAFAGLGTSIRDWAVGDGKLRCTISDKDHTSLLAIRMNETAPAAISCEVRFLGHPSDTSRCFGFNQLDASLSDTSVEALAPLPDINLHKIVCVWADDLALYVDGRCMGRYPAFRHTAANAPDVDYPLALVTYGPVEIRSLKVAPIDKFSDRPVAVRDGNRGRRGREIRTRRLP